MLIQQPSATYDVLVVGGGMVGASFALDLARRCAETELTIAIVETVATGDMKNQPSFDSRSTALAWGSRAIYEGMGIWGRLSEVVTPITEIQVSDHGHFGVTRLQHSEQAVDALGYVVENRELGHVLNEALLSNAAIDLLAPATILSARPQAHGMTLQIKSADQQFKVSAGLVVLADGGRSPLCSQLGIEHTKTSYDQCALISNIAVQNSHDNVAYERFTESGPLAVLPLNPFAGQSRCSLVWTVAGGSEQELISCGDNEFITKLQEVFGNRLGAIVKVGERVAYPLHLTEAREQIRPGLVLLGNVAHTLHPVAGQGLNLALRDAACLTRTISNAADKGVQPGDMAVLQTYLDQQMPDQQEAITFTDQMVNLFSTGSLGKLMARKAGLLSLDLIPPLRKEFAQRAMGIVSNPT